MKSMIENDFIGWLVPFLCGGVAMGIAWVWKKIVSYRKKIKKLEDDIEYLSGEELGKRMELLENGMQSLLRAEIIRQYEKWSGRGYMPIYAKEALQKEYEAYHALGGNDVATDLYERAMELPTEPPM